jgi:choline dehydrogenase-like flavoprotein
MSDRYDVIIDGSGAGGAAVAYKLARTGRQVLLLEKGRHLPRDGSTLSSTASRSSGGSGRTICTVIDHRLRGWRNATRASASRSRRTI